MNEHKTEQKEWNRMEWNVTNQNRTSDSKDWNIPAYKPPADVSFQKSVVIIDQAMAARKIGLEKNKELGEDMEKNKELEKNKEVEKEKEDDKCESETEDIIPIVRQRIRSPVPSPSLPSPSSSPTEIPEPYPRSPSLV